MPRTPKQPLPVIFKLESPEATPCAFFPTLPADRYGRFLTCYARVGQHSGAAWDYFHGLKPCSAKDAAPLLNELQQIYDDCELVVRKRVSPKMRRAFNAEWRVDHA